MESRKSQEKYRKINLDEFYKHKYTVRIEHKDGSVYYWTDVLDIDIIKRGLFSKEVDIHTTGKTYRTNPKDIVTYRRKYVVKWDIKKTDSVHTKQKKN